MTVSSTTSSETFNCDGATVAFTCPFRALDSTDLRAYLITVSTGARVLLENGVDYTVTGAGTDANVVVTTVATYSNLYQIKCARSTARVQPIDYRDNDPFPAESHERGLDRSVMMAQEVDADVARSLRVPSGEIVNELPDAAARANTVQAYDSLGQPTVQVPSTGSAADVLLQLANTTDTTKGDALVAAKYEATGSAALNLHSYIEDDGAYNVMGFVAEADKAAIRNKTSVIDQTAAVQAALSAAYSDNMRGLRFPRGLFNVGALSQTMSGTRLTQGLRIYGAGRNATVLKQFGAPAKLLNFQSASPSTAHAAAQLVIEHMTLQGAYGAAYGLTLDGISDFELKNLTIEGFARGANLSSALLGVLTDMQIANCTVGLMTRRHGTAAYCNAVTARRVNVVGCSGYGFDIGDANQFFIDNCDIETNGSAVVTAVVTITNASPAVISWAAHGFAAGQEVFFTTTGALPTGLSAVKGYYVIAAGLAAGTFQVSATPGGAAINTSSAGSGVHTGFSASGHVIVRDTCDDEDGTGQFFARNGVWMEAGSGFGLRVEPMPSAFDVVLASGHIKSQVAGRSMLIGQVKKITMNDFKSPSAGDTWDISADQAFLTSTTTNILADAGVVSPTYVNVGTGAADYISGKTGSFPVILTGCTTSPPGTVTYTKQGKTVTINLPNITGTSNTTAATLTGMPPSLWPSVNRTLPNGGCIDSGVSKASQITVTTAGVIALNNGYAVFTNAGTKGCEPGTYTYEI